VIDQERWVEETLVDLVGIFSPSGEEGEIVDHVEGLLAGAGFEPRRIPTPGGHDNVVAGAAEPNLVLTAHLDTIRPTWPWDGRAEVRDGLVFGLGAVDDKGGVAAAMLGITMAEADLAAAGVAVAFTVDEEVNGTGSLAVAEALRPRYTIALEGTGLSPGIAEAGVVAGSAEVFGRSVHGSLPEFGDNAIVKAARLILDLEDAAFTGAEHPLLGPALPCVERISGGSPLYAVPDRAVLGFDIRVVPGVTAAEVVDEVGVICSRYEASLEIEEAVDAFQVPEGSALVQALNAAARRVTGAVRPVAGVRAWTDAHNFTAAGSEAVVFGPGRLIGSAHQPDEHVPIDDVVVCGRIIADLITTEAARL
jgi:acetylornithine deacetylase/succinyl-diaminopimelate desuccinylase-like protein